MIKPFLKNLEFCQIIKSFLFQIIVNIENFPVITQLSFFFLLSQSICVFEFDELQSIVATLLQRFITNDCLFNTLLTSVLYSIVQSKKFPLETETIFPILVRVNNRCVSFHNIALLLLLCKQNPNIRPFCSEFIIPILDNICLDLNPGLGSPPENILFKSIHSINFVRKIMKSIENLTNDIEKKAFDFVDMFWCDDYLDCNRIFKFVRVLIQKHSILTFKYLEMTLQTLKDKGIGPYYATELAPIFLYSTLIHQNIDQIFTNQVFELCFSYIVGGSSPDPVDQFPFNRLVCWALINNQSIDYNSIFSLINFHLNNIQKQHEYQYRSILFIYDFRFNCNFDFFQTNCSFR